MRLLAVKSIPLSSETWEAWRSVDVRFMRSSRHPDEAYELAERYEYDAILNLGNRSLPVSGEVPVFNHSHMVDFLTSPLAMRHSEFGSLLPAYPDVGEACWVKRHGRGGSNKIFLEDGLDADRLTAHIWFPPDDLDVQTHLEGVEYRVVTVGVRVVQVSERVDDGDGGRSYRWIGLSNTPAHVKAFARYAAAILDEPLSVVGWDIMYCEPYVYLLEGNTCPGVNADTARRVASEMQIALQLAPPPETRLRIHHDEAVENILSFDIVEQNTTATDVTFSNDNHYDRYADAYDLLMHRLPTTDS